MNIESYVVGDIQANCYLATCTETGVSVIIDPGGITDTLLDRIRQANIQSILLTHGHFDHIAGAGRINAACGAPINIHRADAVMLADPTLNGSVLIGKEVTAPEAASFLEDGDEIIVGHSSLRVAHTPGHSSGSVSLIGDTFILSGDTLFRMSVGRWDLPGGNYNTLLSSLVTFQNLPDDMLLYPGHGHSSTIGFEKRHNEFLAGI